MKPMQSILAVVIVAGAMTSSIASAANMAGVISSDVSTEGSYCHMKFAAIREETLASKHPVLKDASSGDIIDFYGSCNHDPLGKDEIQAQLRDLQRRRARHYMD